MIGPLQTVTENIASELESSLESEALADDLIIVGLNLVDTLRLSGLTWCTLYRKLGNRDKVKRKWRVFCYFVEKLIFFKIHA